MDEYQKREAESVEKEHLDETDWEEIYAIWKNIKNPKLLYKRLIRESSRKKKNNTKPKRKKKRERKECRTNNRKNIYYEMKDAHELLQYSVFYF
ncbi:hypothetical protein S83_048001 [Arachis hypogaea]